VGREHTRLDPILHRDPIHSRIGPKYESNERFSCMIIIICLTLSLTRPKLLPRRGGDRTWVRVGRPGSPQRRVWLASLWRQRPTGFAILFNRVVVGSVVAVAVCAITRVGILSPSARPPRQESKHAIIRPSSATAAAIRYHFLICFSFPTVKKFTFLRCENLRFSHLKKVISY